MFRASRVPDALLLIAGLTLIASATVLSLKPENTEPPSVMAMHAQRLTEGRSAQR
jgi:hypothetical protein